MFSLRTGVSAPQALVLICVRNDLLPDSHMFALRTGVSAPQALVLICVRNDLFCYNRSGWRWGCVRGVVRIQFSAANQQRDETKHTSSNFRAKTVGPIRKVFSCKDEATAKNFVWNKSSSHSQEKL